MGPEQETHPHLQMPSIYPGGGRDGVFFLDPPLESITSSNKKSVSVGLCPKTSQLQERC